MKKLQMIDEHFSFARRHLSIIVYVCLFLQQERMDFNSMNIPLAFEMIQKQTICQIN